MQKRPAFTLVLLALAIEVRVARDVTERTVFLLGQTGVGKSALGNELMHPSIGDEDEEQSEDNFKVGSGIRSTTEAVKKGSAVLNEWWGYMKKKTLDAGSLFKQVPPLRLHVFDTPGLGDTDGRSTKFLDKIIKDIILHRPHGLILVLKHGKISPELQLSLRAFSECLGAALEDPFRIVVFVNMLPTNATLKMEGIKGKAIVQKRKELIRDSVDLVRSNVKVDDSATFNPVAFSNTYDTWDGLPDLLTFITAQMPDTQMSVEGIRTWSEVEVAANRQVSAAEETKALIDNKKARLQRRLEQLQDQKKSYDAAMLGAKSGAAGVVGTVAGTLLTISYFVPGVNIVSSGVTAAAVAAGAVASAGTAVVGTENVYWTRTLPGLIQKAQEELNTFLSLDQEGQAAEELRRLAKFKMEIDELRKQIDRNTLQNAGID
mmetsp:Transcript_88145/g.169710  ORF Transcript_88145/g.169710 Transcript_88145/m.169710 type:complete len:432 (-) Transcript_88145:199-1494(-)